MPVYTVGDTMRKASIQHIHLRKAIEEIREMAINELGMVYATEENVVLYKNTSQNYVSQYEQVPEEGATIVDSIMNLK